MCQRDAAAGRSFDALENADVVRDACATHVEDAGEVRILDLHVAGLSGAAGRQPCIDTPVAPIGWPLDLRPPEGLTGKRPLFSVSPSAIARAPLPSGTRPMASYSMSSAMVKQSWVSTNDRSGEAHAGIGSARFHASGTPSS